MLTGVVRDGMLVEPPLIEKGGVAKNDFCTCEAWAHPLSTPLLVLDYILILLLVGNSDTSCFLCVHCVCTAHWDVKLSLDVYHTWASTI